MKPEKYIQVGVTALRDPKTGGYLPAVPLYIEADDSARAAEADLMQDIGKLLADRMRRYMAECKAEELSEAGSIRSVHRKA